MAAALPVQVGRPSRSALRDLFDALPTRIVQILENLLGNASKYSDDGAGIPPDALEEVFGLFAQADAARDRSRGGLGIGLALVRRLVSMHGGTVVAHSEGVGCGARFTVRLPLA